VDGDDAAFFAEFGVFMEQIVPIPGPKIRTWGTRHFQCDSVIGFPAKDFNSWEYYGWRSTGTLIGLDGAIVK